MILLFFILFAGMSVAASVFILFSKNLLYCLYAFLVVLVGVAGVFIIAGADFVGVSQIMIYIGGVLILFLFGIMLGPARKNREELLQVRSVNRLPAILLGLLIFVCLLTLQQSLGLEGAFEPNLDVNTVRVLGMNLLTNYVLVLELLGLLLLMALIGATFLAASND